MKAEPQFVTRRQLAERVGKHVNTIKGWEKDGDLPPAFRLPGGEVVWKSETIENWLRGLEKSDHRREKFRRAVSRPPNGQDLVTEGELGAFLGETAETVRGWAAGGGLPMHTILPCGSYAWRRAVIRDWFAQYARERKTA